MRDPGTDSAPIICVIGLRGIPNVMGGVETHCEELLPRVKNLVGDHVDIKLLARRGYIHKPTQFNGVHVVPVFTFKNKYLEAIIHSAMAVLAAKLTYSASIVHIHAVGPALTAPLARILGMKVVVTHHGEDFRRAKWNWFAKKMLRLGEAAAVHWSQKMIVISHSIRHRLVGKYTGIDIGRIVVIPNGYPQNNTEKNDLFCRTFNIERGSYVVTVARLVPEKGIQDLIAAFRLSKESIQGKKLVIIGDSDSKDKFARELMAQADDDVVFTGRLPREMVMSGIENSSLFVLPSYHEGLPFAALEALACGARVLLSEIPGNLELSLPKPNYFRAGDVGSLAHKLTLDHDGYRVDKSVLSRFDWDVIARETTEIYLDLLKAPQLDVFSSARPSTQLTEDSKHY